METERTADQFRNVKDFMDTELAAERLLFINNVIDVVSQRFS